MQFELFRPPRLPAATPEELLAVGGRLVPLRFVRHRRARRYVLRVDRDGAARVTVPRSGSLVEARHFAERQAAWLDRQFARRAAAAGPRTWGPGTAFFFRGERVTPVLTNLDDRLEIRFADQAIAADRDDADLRPTVETHLRRLAAAELPPRVMEYAAMHQLLVRRVQVRAQRSRWGSCSRRGTISLNWRLIQTPPFVRDYIILHELMHLREMNHSARFWREVESVCPCFDEAERWLKKCGRELLRD
jgi:predicted metal-dependent hydrolase